MVGSAKYTIIYCVNCKKSLGKYNTKFYNDDKIKEMLKTAHSVHVKNGHTIQIREMRVPP